jgi:hypothetical protein
MDMVKHKMTQQNLESAYSGESQAHMRYLIFSEVAEREGKPNIARLFKLYLLPSRFTPPTTSVIWGISMTR